ncbi:MAG: hypothetical protein ACRCX2_04300 [Paraclostridium sp.]
MTYRNMLETKGYIHGNNVNRCWNCNGNCFNHVGDLDEYDVICSNCNTNLTTIIEGKSFLNIEYGDLNYK